MALDQHEASRFAKELLVAIAQSGEMKLIGPNATAGGAEVERQHQRGEKDAAYLASLYRNLVDGLQE